MAPAWSAWTRLSATLDRLGAAASTPDLVADAGAHALSSSMRAPGSRLGRRAGGGTAAPKRDGARRVLPPDYALDLFKATPGGHAAFDMRREADEAIGEAGLEQANVLQGGFMQLLRSGMGAIDLD